MNDPLLAAELGRAVSHSSAKLEEVHDAPPLPETNSSSAAGEVLPVKHVGFSSSTFARLSRSRNSSKSNSSKTRLSKRSRNNESREEKGITSDDWSGSEKRTHTQQNMSGEESFDTDDPNADLELEDGPLNNSTIESVHAQDREVHGHEDEEGLVAVLQEIAYRAVDSALPVATVLLVIFVDAVFFLSLEALEIEAFSTHNAIPVWFSNGYTTLDWLTGALYFVETVLRIFSYGPRHYFHSFLRLLDCTVSLGNTAAVAITLVQQYARQYLTVVRFVRLIRMVTVTTMTRERRVKAHALAELEELAVLLDKERSDQNRLIKWRIDGDAIALGEAAGKGGFGTVYLGLFRGTLVAVKQLYQNNTEAKEYTSIEDEAVTLVNLRHPNVVLFMGFVHEPSKLWIVTEYCSRGSLRDLLDNKELRLTQSRILKFALGAARGLAYLHGQDPPVLHLDLKTSNILISSGWETKLADFGLSKNIDNIQNNTFAGTIQYSAPEILESNTFGIAADVYSFGICLWEMAAREIPFEGTSPMEVLWGVVKQKLRPPIEKIVTADPSSELAVDVSATPDLVAGNGEPAEEVRTQLDAAVSVATKGKGRGRKSTVVLLPPEEVSPSKQRHSSPVPVLARKDPDDLHRASHSNLETSADLTEAWSTPYRAQSMAASGSSRTPTTTSGSSTWRSHRYFTHEESMHRNASMRGMETSSAESHGSANSSNRDSDGKRRRRRQRPSFMMVVQGIGGVDKSTRHDDASSTSPTVGPRSKRTSAIIGPASTGPADQITSRLNDKIRMFDDRPSVARRAPEVSLDPTRMMDSLRLRKSSAEDVSVPDVSDEIEAMTKRSTFQQRLESFSNMSPRTSTWRTGPSGADHGLDRTGAGALSQRKSATVIDSAGDIVIDDDNDEETSIPGVRMTSGYTDLILRCWAQAPEDRPTADEVVWRLVGMIDDQMKRDALAATNSQSPKQPTNNDNART